MSTWSVTGENGSPAQCSVNRSRHVASASSTWIAGTPATRRRRRARARSPGARRAGRPRRSPKRTASGPRVVGDHDAGPRRTGGSAPPRPRAARPGRAQPQAGPPLDDGRRRAPTPARRSPRAAIVSASSTRPVASGTRPTTRRVERGRLARRAVDVGVEADVAEEDAVGLGHRLLAHDDAPGRPRKRARELAQPPAQGARLSGPGSPRSATRRAGRSGTPRAAPERPSPSRAARPRSRGREPPQPARPAAPGPTCGRAARGDAPAASPRHDRRQRLDSVGRGDVGVAVPAEREAPVVRGAPPCARCRGPPRRKIADEAHVREARARSAAWRRAGAASPLSLDERRRGRPGGRPPPGRSSARAGRGPRRPSRAPTCRPRSRACRATLASPSRFEPRRGTANGGSVGPARRRLRCPSVRSVLQRDVGEHEHPDQADEPAVAARAGRELRPAGLAGSGRSPPRRRRACRGRGPGGGPSDRRARRRRPGSRRRGRRRPGRARPARPARQRGQLAAPRSTSTAGSTTARRPSATARSTTVTRPKLRTMAMSESASTPKPAIAVTPGDEHRRAGRAVRAPQRPATSWPRQPLLAEALGEQHAELGGDRDDQRAERGRHRVERIGATSERGPARGQRDRDQRHDRAADVGGRRPSSASPTATRPSSSVPRRRHGSVRRSLASAAEHRQAGEPGAHARRRVRARARIASMTCCWRSSGMSRMPKARLASRAVARDDRAGEVARHGGEQAAHLGARGRAARGGEEVGQRERRAQRRRRRSRAWSV